MINYFQTEQNLWLKVSGVLIKLTWKTTQRCLFTKLLKILIGFNIVKYFNIDQIIFIILMFGLN